MDDSNPEIIINVTTRYLDDQSEPEQKRFVFLYEITIDNQSSNSVQLINRHWIITDGQGKTQEVRGDGVVGEQPVIEAGNSFRYTSGTLLATEVGSMYGSFGMQKEDGSEFNVPIAAFTLAKPGTLH